ncbi:MAG: hypothetical protein UY96_C0022G0012 [Parcubacteria group bacterium GW2011_GWB1_56_8]|nr:MAG: hypothetical protein UY96_C0022G0012 [Parcubacteria group bacterium GW2011_GWB1_56_8]
MSVEITVRIKLGEKDFTLTMDEMRKLHDILQYCFNERKAGLYPYMRQYPAATGFTGLSRQNCTETNHADD